MSNSLFAAFTYEQMDTLRTSLSMRLDRINDLIQIFSKDPENTEDQWMVARYKAEANQVSELMREIATADHAC
jgi:hypothetical protein